MQLENVSVVSFNNISVYKGVTYTSTPIALRIVQTEVNGSNFFLDLAKKLKVESEITKRGNLLSIGIQI